MAQEFAKFGFISQEDLSKRKIFPIDTEDTPQNTQNSQPSALSTTSKNTISKKRSNTLVKSGKKRSSTLQMEVGNDLADYQVHSIRIDNKQFEKIQGQFKDLVKPINEGIAEATARHDQLQELDNR